MPLAITVLLLSNASLLAVGGGDPVSVPDAGSTSALLGVALGSLLALRKKLSGARG